MVSTHNSNQGETQIPIGAALVIAAMAAVAAGLVLPLLVGFSATQMIILATVEVACLGMLASGVIIMSQRLRASHQALWELARRDELTGVGNYRGLHERLAEEISRHRRRSRGFALILLDLNSFKQINETHGHLEGDRLLAEIGAALKEEVRHEDAVFRQGGDEFAVIVPETDAQGADEVAERLRERVRRRGFGNDETRPVSAATGAAIFPLDGASSDDLLSAADRALFAAKREDRPTLA
jgi:diguanylate cyclase (GGDEF)-like protein